MIKKFSFLTVLLSSLLVSVNPVFAAPKNAEIEGLIQFLVSKELLRASHGFSVPLSYYVGNQEDIDKYFGDYLCAPTQTCKVTDSLYEQPYAILGKGLASQGDNLEKRQAQAQIERSDVKYGSNIYDAATWQIALGLAGSKGYLDVGQAQELVRKQLEYIMRPENRATNPAFKYGYSMTIPNAQEAFTFRMTSLNFHNKDPFYQGRYQEYLSWDYDPEALAKNDQRQAAPEDFKYVSTWSDWKPITGENAWAQLIGPLQAEYLLQGKVEADSLALTNAINSLYAFSAMQTGIGAFYYAPGGSEGNLGPIAEGEISLENNFSLLGGLQILKQILEHSEQTPRVQAALTQVNTMLYGGQTVNHFKTLGLLSFIYNGAYDKQQGIFYTHGRVASPSSLQGWKPDTSGSAASMAVDVNTWGISALGVETIDAWYGEGTALRMWKEVRNRGGYFNQGVLWGLGYTLYNQNERVMSAEWSAGGINSLRSLIAHYEAKGIDTQELKADLLSMEAGIKHLRSDLYLSSHFEEATPQDYFVRVPKEAGQAYLYASKRYAIPFGWNANTLASTTSNAWVIMNHFNFNPFQYQGKLSGEFYEMPKQVSIME